MSPTPTTPMTTREGRRGAGTFAAQAGAWLLLAALVGCGGSGGTDGGSSGLGAVADGSVGAGAGSGGTSGGSGGGTGLDSGGSGGSPGSTPSGTLYPIDAAITDAFSRGFHVTDLRATDSATGKVYIMAFDLAPLGEQMLDGVAYRAVQRTTLVGESASGTVTVGSDVQYFETGPFRPVASAGNDGRYRYTVTAGSMPAEARIGQSGLLNASAIYSDASRQTLLATSLTSWSVTADGAQGAFVCFTTTVSYVDREGSDRTEECLALASATPNAVSGARITVDVNGSRLVFQ